MDKQVLTDGTGRWFDRDRSERWEEASWWDGHNHISAATGSQWDHQELYRTAQGLYILHCFSQWQGTRPRWELIEPDEAYRWLIENGHEDAAPPAAVEALEI